MQKSLMESLPRFLERLGLDEEPMGVFYSNDKPVEGFSPRPIDLPTRDKEIKNEIDWQAVFSRFSCAMGHVWRARKKKTAAYFSAQQFGCPGCAFWMGFNKPQTETIIQYVSTGIPNWTEGEFYCESPDELRRIFEYVDPRPAPKTYCVFKPLSNFAANETPELIAFFTRPEPLCGLHQLAAFVTNDPEVVASPWSAGCGSVVVWPLHYLSKGVTRAVVGGWDPSARKFYKTDELSFTVPYQMFSDMLNRFEESFLQTKSWATVQKKIERSKKSWGEI
ncbi:MAG: DUF169 domain-containing protein [Deltaproteobacteria bacterium]|jgi:uncharacterized protein (DUF169 family)|nr:DUF169 domain-containing protein [Deltaproteobacteria bacterium]